MRNCPTLLTNWRTREDEDLPSLPPGAEHELVITLQKFTVIHRILTSGVALLHLQVGPVAVPCELVNCDIAFAHLQVRTVETNSEVGPPLTPHMQRMYKPRGLDDELLKKQLLAAGAAIAPSDSIAVAPALEVRVRLRNGGTVPTKPRAALLVYEEI